MFERFTDRARKVMALANQEAQRLRHEYIGTEHILLGLVKEGSGVGANVLKNFDIDLEKVRAEVDKLVRQGPADPTVGKLPQTPRAKKVIEYAIMEARGLNHHYVGTEHLLLGLLREQDGVAAQVLMNVGLKLDGVREEVLNLLGAGLEIQEAPGHGGGESHTRVHEMSVHATADDPLAQRMAPFYDLMHDLMGLCDTCNTRMHEAVDAHDVEHAEVWQTLHTGLLEQLHKLFEWLGRKDDPPR